MEGSQKIIQWGLPFALIISGFLIGIIFRKIVLRNLKKRISVKTKWKVTEIIISSICNMSILWFGIAGLYGSILTTQINPTISIVIQKVLLVIVIFSVTIVLARISAGFINLYTKKVEGILPSPSIFINLTIILIFIIGILIIIKSLGITITPMLTALGVGGLAVAMALRDTLSNLFAGIHIIATKQVKPGDYIKIDTGEKGYVTDITWRNTTIRAIQNNMVIIPNSKLASTKLINYYQPQKEMAVLVQVGVSYDSDLKIVEKVTIEVAKEVMKEIPGGVTEFEPFIRYHTFSDFSINFTVILRAKEFFDKYIIKHELVKRLHKRYQEEGIVIPFPIRTVHIQKE